jgi:hypothetical protein
MSDWFLAGIWTAYAVWTLADGEPVSAPTAAMLCGVIALGFAASASRSKRKGE